LILDTKKYKMKNQILLLSVLLTFNLLTAQHQCGVRHGDDTEIKARMLLPVKKTESGEEPEDPRAELVRRLLEYEKMKLAAQQLDALPQLGRDFQRAQAFADLRIERALPDVSVEDLRQAA
jgi:hypothetical protein